MKGFFDVVESREGFIDRYDNLLTSVRVRLTAAQVKALNATPQTLIAAPGPNKFISIEKVVGTLFYDTAVFTGANALEFRATDGTGTNVAEDMSSGFLNSATDIIAVVSGSSYWGEVTRILDKPIVVTVPVANPGGALAVSILQFIVIYRIIKVYNA